MWELNVRGFRLVQVHRRRHCPQDRAKGAVFEHDCKQVSSFQTSYLAIHLPDKLAESLVRNPLVWERERQKRYSDKLHETPSPCPAFPVPHPAGHSCGCHTLLTRVTYWEKKKKSQHLQDKPQCRQAAKCHQPPIALTALESAP